MGTTADMYRRLKKRVDNEDVRRKIKLAQKWIFEDGLGVASAAVENLLQESSLLPNLVCHRYICMLQY